ncbi:amino acid kinase family protein [Sporosarcina gallistercoris]|uniref:aspartate kinase n=1 Tax=Sporosarcina gallistercoris TaxID=2762245 RepID=A0ABR8PGM1_9BACL|nr:aspartate kinase [Sporosarcina gallistercoris]MBD7907239.1 aspartate kinase [Sporosarcina gallistercoris]
MIIQKFGGAAMKDRAMRRLCIDRIQEGLKSHEKVIVVVSAIGRQESPYSTDRLLSITPSFKPSTASWDLAASCGELIASAVLSAELEEAGTVNKVMHSMNSGIKTVGQFGNATIETIETSYIEKTLQSHKCLIIPGFQGLNAAGDYMTLGRGGSDLTAIALGSSLKASHVEFFKDVPGVMSADPHIYKDAEKFASLTIDEFLPLLDCTRPVIQKRAALHAKETAIPLCVRGIAVAEEGTWITPCSS